MSILYFIEGEKRQTFKWEGHLAFGESALITLPTEIFSKKPTAKFHVELIKRMGKKDAFNADNKMDLFMSGLIFYLKRS